MLDPRNPAAYPQRILLVVCGQTPQVITETLHGLVTSARAFVPTRILAVTTRAGKKGITRNLFADGKFAALRADLLDRHMAGTLPDQCVDRARIEALAFDEADIHVPRTPDGIEDEDAHGEAELERMGDLMLTTLCECAAADTAIHVSLAGGRKSMSYLAGLALSLAGRAQDRLSHVLVSDPRFESCRDFYFPPLQPVELAVGQPSVTLSTVGVQVLLVDVPFVRTRLLLGEHALIDPVRPKRLSDLVNEANAALEYEGEGHTLIFDTHRGRVWCDGVQIPFSLDEFSFYYAVVKFAEAGIALTSRPSDEDCERYLEWRAHVTPGGVECRQGSGWLFDMQEPYESLFGVRIFQEPTRLATLKHPKDVAELNKARSGFFSPKRTLTNKRLRATLGRAKAEVFLVQSLGGKGGRPAEYSLNAAVALEFRNEQARKED